MVFLTYSVAGVILPSLTTKYVAKSMMVSIKYYENYKLVWQRNRLKLYFSFGKLRKNRFGSYCQSYRM